MPKEALEGGGGVDTKGHRFLLKIIVVAITLLCQYNKNLIVCSKWINRMTYELQLKIEKKKLKQGFAYTKLASSLPYSLGTLNVGSSGLPRAALIGMHHHALFILCGG